MNEIMPVITLKEADAAREYGYNQYMKRKDKNPELALEDIRNACQMAVAQVQNKADRKWVIDLIDDWETLFYQDFNKKYGLGIEDDTDLEDIIRQALKESIDE